MLIIHPDFISEYAKCNDCKTIHIITRVNTEIQDNCKKCKCSHFTIVDNSTVPITKNECMPFVDISRFLIE
jgi:Zn finger protein HypA/HybF involved in hydrogenase expression